jgi:hypothetical protein
MTAKQLSFPFTAPMPFHVVPVYSAAGLAALISAGSINGKFCEK